MTDALGFDRDPEFIERVRPLLGLYSDYFDAEVRGFEHVPEKGPFLVVANHSGGAMAPDLPILLTEWWRRRGVEEPVYGLFHSVFIGIPGIGSAAAKAGAIEARPENVQRVLEAGGVVVVFPGGDHEAYRPWHLRNQIDFAGRTGFVKEALQHQVPVVPCVSHGVQDGTVVVWRGERLAQALPFMRSWRIKVYPIMIGPPFGLSVGIPAFPLPSKATVQLCPPIDLTQGGTVGPEAADDEEVVRAGYERVTTTMQQALDALVEERRASRR
jgi:1-acyl-sn-glycerol-3-phosphate acyltransferase